MSTKPDFKANSLNEQSVHLLGIDKNKLKDKKYIINKAFKNLINPNRTWDQQSLKLRIQLVRSLENILRTEFKNTKDFRRQIAAYLEDSDFRKRDFNLRIKSARKKLKITQKQLAERLGYKSHVTIAYFEKGSRYPSKRVIQWLEEIGM